MYNFNPKYKQIVKSIEDHTYIYIYLYTYPIHITYLLIFFINSLYKP